LTSCLPDIIALQASAQNYAHKKHNWFRRRHHPGRQLRHARGSRVQTAAQFDKERAMRDALEHNKLYPGHEAKVEHE